MDKVVNHNYILERSVLNNSEIFDKEAILSLHTVFSMQKPENSLLRSVQIIDDRLCVVKSSSCKDIDVIILTHVCQKLKTVRSDIKSKFISFMIVSDISFLILIEDRVNESLIKIHYQEFLFRV